MHRPPEYHNTPGKLNKMVDFCSHSELQAQRHPQPRAQHPLSVVTTITPCKLHGCGASKRAMFSGKCGIECIGRTEVSSVRFWLSYTPFNSLTSQLHSIRFPFLYPFSISLFFLFISHYSRARKMAYTDKKQVIEYLSKKGYSRTEAMLRAEAATQDHEGRPIASRAEDAGGAKYARGFGMASSPM